MSGIPALTDIHCHFVPGVDDGAPSLDSALGYLREYVELGITTVCTTPHLPGLQVHGERRAEIEEAFGGLEEAARAALPALSLSLAYEIRLDDPEVDLSDRALCLGDGGHVLVEFPMLVLPAYPGEMLASVLEQGRTPVLAHPERYYGVERAYRWIERWRDMGAVMCVNAGSLWGEYGPEAERVGRRMLALGHADAIASDHHARPHRASHPRQAWDFLTGGGSEETARAALGLNPAAILRGDALQPVPPIAVPDGWIGRLRRMVRRGAT